MKSINKELITVNRDCNAILVPGGEKVVLVEGTHVRITQALGGDFTVYVNGNLLKISGKDSDAIGMSVNKKTATIKTIHSNENITEQDAWDVMKTCYDPEIPVNIVDLGLIYDLKLDFFKEKGTAVEIKMTLTAPGCGMGPAIADDAKNKVLQLPGIFDVNIHLVWDPQWNRDMMTEEAKLQLNLL